MAAARELEASRPGGPTPGSPGASAPACPWRAHGAGVPARPAPCTSPRPRRRRHPPPAATAAPPAGAGPGAGARGPGPGAGPGGSPPPAPWYVPAYGVRAGPQGLGGGVRVPRARPTDSARRARGRYSAPAGPRAECGRARANWGPERRARAAFQQQVASRVWGAESGRRGRAGGGLSAWGRCPRALGGSLRRVRGTLEVAAWPGRLHSNGPGPVAARIPAGGRRGATQPVGAPAVAAVSLAPPPAFFPGEALAAQAPVRARQGRAPVTRERRL